MSPETPLSRRDWLGLVPPALAATIGAGLIGPRAARADEPPPAGAGSADRGVRVYNVRDYGAKGDAATLDTAAVQAAIDACAADAGGVVLVPAGTFLIGTIELKSNVTLRVAAAATLLGSHVAADYHAVDAIPLSGDSTLGDGHWALIFAVGAKNVTIEGPGLIDGQGSYFHSPVRGRTPPSGLGGSRRPYLLLFYQCTNLVVRNIDLFRSGYHMVRVIQSSYVHMHALHIYNRVSGNNDGFHFISAKHVTVSDCFVESQDDACALFGSCQFVTVTNCAFSTRWSVFRFGGGTAENIAVSNCLLYQVFGCPFKFEAHRGSRFENMSFANILLQEVTGPINFSVAGADYRERSPRPPRQPTPEEVERRRQYENAPPGIVRRISFSNIHGTVTTSPSQLPGYPFPNGTRPGEKMSCIALNCVGDGSIENVSFDNIHLTFGGGGTAQDAAHIDLPPVAGEYFELGSMPAYGFYARNSRGLTLNNVRLEVSAPELRPALILDRVTDVAISGLGVQGDRNAQSVLRFRNARDVLLTAPRVLTPSPAFLQVEGEETSNVIVDGGDLSKASVPLDLKPGVPPAAVRLRGQG